MQVEQVRITRSHIRPMEIDSVVCVFKTPGVVNQCIE
jgi:hypothetical protein